MQPFLYFSIKVVIARGSHYFDEFLAILLSSWEASYMTGTTWDNYTPTQPILKINILQSRVFSDLQLIKGITSSPPYFTILSKPCCSCHRYQLHTFPLIGLFNWKSSQDIFYVLVLIKAQITWPYFLTMVKVNLCCIFKK